jgi:polar amino acid transport system substrate-binding protein
LEEELVRSAWILILFLASALSAPVQARSLEEIRSSGVLRWCGDQEGGGPFIYPDENDPEKLLGFEVDIAPHLAKHLGVRSEFVQGPWDKLLDMQRAGKCDIVMNGYERFPERIELFGASVPYHVYALQLLVRKDEVAIADWEDMKKPYQGRKFRIGVLTGSAAEEAARELCGEDCEVSTYDGGTDTMREVETGKLDASIQDTPIAAFYAPRFPGLRPAGAPRAPGYYVLYFDKAADDLKRLLDEALLGLMRSGELQRIDERYGIWDAPQVRLAEIVESADFLGIAAVAPAAPAASPGSGAAAASQPGAQTGGPMESVAEEKGAALPGARLRGLAVIQRTWKVLLKSAGLTVVLSVVSFPLAILLGLLVAVGRLYGPRWVRVPLTGYVEFLRGTPLMLQLYFIFFLLPEIGIVLPAFATAVLGLAVNYSAYEAEIYRAGLQAVPKGQLEAGLSLGMSRWQAIRRIVVPQAVRIVVPPVVNDFIALFKDTSVCSAVTLVELTKRFSVLSMSTQATVELMAVTALLYLLMSYPMSVLSRAVEKRLEGGPVT